MRICNAREASSNAVKDANVTFCNGQGMVAKEMKWEKGNKE